VIGYLQGRLINSSPEKLLIDVQGVGYEVHIPLSTYSEIQRRPVDVPVGVFIYTHLREGALELFGFYTAREKALFEKLIGVGGIGPKLARVILSGMAPDDLLASLAAGDLVRLTTIPGVGKKSAERMVLELKDKIHELMADMPGRPAPGPSDDLVLALVNLGYKEAEADRAVRKAREAEPDAEFEELLRSSLKVLSRA
jgi:Holliday junction DNA helicase RuvA